MIHVEKSERGRRDRPLLLLVFYCLACLHLHDRVRVGKKKKRGGVEIVENQKAEGGGGRRREGGGEKRGEEGGEG